MFIIRRGCFKKGDNLFLLYDYFVPQLGITSKHCVILYEKYHYCLIKRKRDCILVIIDNISDNNEKKEQIQFAPTISEHLNFYINF